MNKDRKRKKRKIITNSNNNKEEEEEGKENEENEDQELQYNFNQENISIEKEIRKYKIVIGILITIIILLMLCVIYQLYNNKTKSEQPIKTNLNENNKEVLNKLEINKDGDNNNDNNGGDNNNNNVDKVEMQEAKQEIKETTAISTIQSFTGEKRKIYVKYMDFWPAFKLERFDVHRILLERYEVIQSDNPDYVIFGEFGGENYGIENRINCIKLFLSIENRDPNFDNTDYAIGIHYIDMGDRYFRKPTETHQLSAIQTVYNVTQVKNIDIPSKKFCAWVVSNGGGSERNKFFDKLSQYKVVDSGGSFRNNVGGPVGDKLEFLSHYKFSICFENSKTQGYISEKLVDAFEAGTIPIYFGDDTILELLNNKSYIHVKSEDEFDEKIELIKQIDNNDTLYQEMIREKIVIDDTRYAKELQKYKDFIYHVIEQDKEKAKRFKRTNENFKKDENKEGDEH